eukprot:361979-Chlamydomonas_euryale.AAC.1
MEPGCRVWWLGTGREQGTEDRPTGPGPSLWVVFLEPAGKDMPPGTCSCLCVVLVAEGCSSKRHAAACVLCLWRRPAQ